MRRWVWLPFYFGILWAHVALASLFSLRSAAPDLLLAGALLLGLLRGPVSGALAGLILGLSGDILAGRLVGLSSLSLALAGSAAGFVARRVFRENLAIVAATAFILSMVAALAYGLGAKALGVPFRLGPAMLAVGLPVALYSSALVPVIYAVTFRRLGLHGGDNARNE